MKADPRFKRQSKEFWAHVRTISQEAGYTDRRTSAICIPTLDQVRSEFTRLRLNTSDMLHMGYVDEVLFGREVLVRLPEIAREWKRYYDELARIKEVRGRGDAPIIPRPS